MMRTRQRQTGDGGSGQHCPWQSGGWLGSTPGDAAAARSWQGDSEPCQLHGKNGGRVLAFPSSLVSGFIPTGLWHHGSQAWGEGKQQRSVDLEEAPHMQVANDFI